MGTIVKRNRPPVHFAFRSCPCPADTCPCCSGDTRVARPARSALVFAAAFVYIPTWPPQSDTWDPSVVHATRGGYGRCLPRTRVACGSRETPTKTRRPCSPRQAEHADDAVRWDVVQLFHSSCFAAA